MTVQEANDRHFSRLRRIDRLFDTGKITWEEMIRLERAEEYKYDKELSAALS